MPRLDNLDKKCDYPVIDQAFLTLILKKNWQMYGTVRDYKVRGADLTRLIPEYHSKIKRYEKKDYIFRLRVELPAIEVYKN